MTALILVSGFGAGAPAFATASVGTLYVNNAQGANCSDSGPGTQAQPYCTIQPAVDAASAGQTVYVSQRMYTGEVDITRSGTPAAGCQVLRIGPADRVSRRAGAGRGSGPRPARWPAALGACSARVLGGRVLLGLLDGVGVRYRVVFCRQFFTGSGVGRGRGLPRRLGDVFSGVSYGAVLSKARRGRRRLQGPVGAGALTVSGAV